MGLSAGPGRDILSDIKCGTEVVPLMPPSHVPSLGLKGRCLAATLSEFKWFLCYYFFLEGSASKRRQP